MLLFGEMLNIKFVLYKATLPSQYAHIIVKDLISRSGIRLIELFYKGNTYVSLHFVRLGEVGIYFNDEKYTIEKIESELKDELGFEPIRNPELQLVEKIRIAAIELIHYANNTNSLVRNSDYISEKMGMPYDKLSRLFSQYTGRTLEQYIILLKMEKIKSLLTQNEWNVSEISYMMGYSSVQYMSNQFKKITGITLSAFKRSHRQYKIALEEL